MKSKALMAETHPNEYLIHKYWARKPSNILREYISSHFKNADLLVDPFCGSGVFLAEAKKQNINATGYDINPLAYLLSEVTANPPSITKFTLEADKLLKLADSFANLYTVDGKEIRYAVHRVESVCSNCKEIGSIDHSSKRGSKYHCSSCGERLFFNFEKFKGTKIVKIFDRENKEYTEKKYLKEQEDLIRKVSLPVGNQNLIPNRRILAFPGMRLSDLFTPRAFYVLSELFDAAHKVKDESVKNAVLLFLTSSVAQSSRLIPYRNNLSTGGPAWTIPGFWIAPLHLETNPIIHLQARKKKFLKGIEALDRAYKSTSARVSVLNRSAHDALSELEDNSVDGIFFDPPYGDNVPYVEFSAIWNGFLRKKIAYEKEIIVSDRKEHVSSWDKYARDISNVISLFDKKLKRRGKILMTFNNLDPRAWKIVLDSFSKNGYVCSEAKYQIPAVVSSKSQTASNTSYVGDYYCIFEKAKTQKKSSHDLFHLTESAKKVLRSRGGSAPKNLVHRVIILTILNEGMNTGFLDRFEEILKPVTTQDGEYYHLRAELSDEKNDASSVEQLVKNIAESSLRDGRKTLKELYEDILEGTSEIGSPLLNEVKTMLSGIVLFDKDFSYLQRAHQNGSLFS